MLNLLVKDLKLLLFGDNTSIKKKIFSLVFTVIFLAAFIAIEIFLFTMVINKVKNFSNATPAILTIFLFIISCIMIVVDLFAAIKLFFNEKDVEQLIRYPVTNEQIIISKMLFLFVLHFTTSLMFIFPIFVAYGMIVGRTPIYYYSVFFYPVLSFLFEAGVALIFVYPIKLVIDYLKKHTLLQFILAIIFLFGASIIYSKVLSIFMDFVLNNELTLLFTESSIATMRKIADMLIPTTFLVQFFLGTSIQIFAYICIGLGVFLIGMVVAILAFNYCRSIRFNSRSKERKSDLKVHSLKFTLIKKELTLLFKDSNNIFSFTGLLILQPFLMYLVLEALNGVFTSGTFAYYLMALPNFIPLLDIVLIMLFTLIINSGANNYITAEKYTIRIMKTIPVSFTTQIFIKVLVPFSTSLISLIVSTSVLYFAKVISLETCLFATLISAVLLFVFELVSLKEELAIRMNKPRSTFLSSVYSYLLPIAFFVVALYSSYYKIDIIYAYLIGLGVVLLLGLPFFIKLKSRTIENFMDLEAVN